MDKAETGGAASQTAATRIAAHLAGLRLDDVPARHVADAKALVADFLGVALGGSRTDSAAIAARFVAETGGRDEATVIGRPAGRVPAVHAAFANAIAGHSIELDDVDVLALFHFSPPVVAAALAVAERENSSGRDFILAVVAGCEIMARVSAATNPSLRDRGFHSTPTTGVFGATAAAAVLLRLEQAQIVSALGLAGAQASGLMEMYGPSMQKRFNPGPTARNGVTAALMAKLGFTGADTIFEGERGFCRAFSDQLDLDALTRDLGTEFPVFIEFKPYSCARPIHNAIDCALAVRKQLREDPGEIVEMTMRRHPSWANYHLNARPRTYHEAQVSLPYSVAVALLEGAALLDQYRDDKLGDPAIGRLAGMLAIVPDESLPRGVSCHLTAVTRSGARYTAQVDHPRGSIANPMTAEEMRAKAYMLADPVIGRDTVGTLLGTIDRIEDVDRIGQLSQLLETR